MLLLLEHAQECAAYPELPWDSLVKHQCGPHLPQDSGKSRGCSGPWHLSLRPTDAFSSLSTTEPVLWWPTQGALHSYFCLTIRTVSEILGHVVFCPTCAFCPPLHSLARYIYMLQETSSAGNEHPSLRLAAGTPADVGWHRCGVGWGRGWHREVPPGDQVTRCRAQNSTMSPSRLWPHKALSHVALFCISVAFLFHDFVVVTVLVILFRTLS